MDRKTFATNVSDYHQDNKLYWKALTLFKAVNNYDFSKLDNIKQIKDCDHKQMMHLINCVFNETNNQKLVDNRQLILSYFEKHKMDGNKFIEMARKGFCESICEFCNNTKLKGPCAKLYNTIKQFDISAINWNNIYEPEEEQKYEQKSIPKFNYKQMIKYNIWWLLK